MAFSVKSHKLREDDKPVETIKSSFMGGKFASTPKILVVHFTYGGTGRSSAEWFKHPANPGSSAHIVCDRDGSVIQCVDFDTVALHAGKSRLRGLIGLNKHSIGLELANWGNLVSSGTGWRTYTAKAISDPVLATHVNGNPDGSTRIIGWERYPEKQFQAAVAIARALVAAYGINEIVGHDDISKGRKWDPGPAFDRRRFNALIFGDRADNGDNRYKVAVGEGLNLRAGPGTQFAAIKLLSAGTVLDLLAVEGRWMNVSIIDNNRPTETGYVHSAYVEEI
jgi:N-acetylmuramoyl-L-alanine amidase